MLSMIARLRSRSLSATASRWLCIFLRNLVMRRTPWLMNNSSANLWEM